MRISNGGGRQAPDYAPRANTTLAQNQPFWAEFLLEWPELGKVDHQNVLDAAPFRMDVGHVGTECFEYGFAHAWLRGDDG
jgi:hypothetical protein